MQKTPLDPDVADVAPTAPALTDLAHRVTYLRLLDAETNGADWKEVAKIVLHLDPDRSPDRARRAWKTHLARAHWITEQAMLRDSASYRMPQARYRPLPVASRRPNSATRFCAARGVILSCAAIMPAETIGRVST